MASLYLINVSASAAKNFPLASNLALQQMSYSAENAQLTLEDTEQRLAELDAQIFALAGNVAWVFQYDDGRIESGAKDGIFATLWSKLTSK